MTVITRIGVLSAGKIAGVLYAAIGLIVGLMVTLFSLLGMAAGTATDAPGAAFGLIFGVGAVIFLPLFYGLLGFICALISAAIYNLVAAWIGGLEIELRQ